jgi:ribosomal protein S6E (S10)
VRAVVVSQPAASQPAPAFLPTVRARATQKRTVLLNNRIRVVLTVELPLWTKKKKKRKRKDVTTRRVTEKVVLLNIMNAQK